MFSVGECIIILIFLTIPFLYDKSRSFRYYFRFSIYYFSLILIAIFIIPTLLWRKRSVQNLVLASKICRNISRVLGLHWEIQGKEYLEKDEAYIIVVNHQSSIDVLGIFELAPVMQKCAIVAKKELLYAQPFGLAAWLCGLIFIDRLNSDTSRQAINDSIQQLKKNKVKLLIFPEGTRKNTGAIHDFKKGAFYAAVNGQIPLLPVVFSQFYFTQKGQSKTLEIGRILVTVLPPISTEGKTTADIPHLINLTRTSMVKAFQQSNLRLTPSELAVKLD